MKCAVSRHSKLASGLQHCAAALGGNLCAPGQSHGTWVNSHLSVLQDALDEVLATVKLGEFDSERNGILENWRVRKGSVSNDHISKDTNDNDLLLDSETDTD